MGGKRPATQAAPVLWRIGEVAKLTGVTTRTLRYWEELGLLQPASRTDGGERIYGAADARRVTRIRDWQELLGFSLDEVKTVLSTGDVDVLDRVHFELKDSGMSLSRRRELLDEAIAANDQLVGRLEDTLSRISALRDERAAIAVRLRKSRDELDEDGNSLSVQFLIGRVPYRYSGRGDSRKAPGLSAHEAPAGDGSIRVPDWPLRPPSFDVSTAHPARVYDYLLGGKDNFAADRAAAEAIVEVSPVVFACVRANRAFLRRAVRYLVGQAGIRQFLDIGTGLPTADNTHQVAQQVAPESRVVYVDNDPIVLAHARALLTSAPQGACDYIDADLRDTDDVLRQAAETLDFAKPVAVMVLCTMQYVPDADDPHAIISKLMSAVPSGSYLAMSDTTRDIDTETMTTGAARYNAKLGSAVFTPRTGAEYARFFDQLSLVEPGLVPMPQWRPDPADDRVEGIPMYAAMGRKR